MKPLSPTLKEFCETQELLRFAYVDRKGYPRVVPVWFVMFDEVCFVGTGAESAKRKAVAQNPSVGWVIDGGERAHYKAWSAYGTAEDITDAETRERVYRALGIKYFGAPDHPKFIEIYGQIEDPATVYWRLNPE